MLSVTVAAWLAVQGQVAPTVRPAGTTVPAVSALIVAHEDKRIPEQTPEWEQGVREMSRACRLLKDGNGVPARMLMLGNAWIMGRIWRDYRPKLEAETGVAWVAGVGMDVMGCVSAPEKLDMWWWTRQTVRELEAQGVRTVYVGGEACYVENWTRLPGWEYERLRFGVSILPASVGYRVYPSLVAGWPGVSDADSAAIEINSRELRAAWRQLPDVRFIATSPLTGAEELLTVWEQRCLQQAQLAGDPIVPMVYVSLTHRRMCAPPRAARLLAQAKDPEQPVLVYLDYSPDMPPEFVAAKVAAERGKFETGLP